MSTRYVWGKYNLRYSTTRGYGNFDHTIEEITNNNITKTLYYATSTRFSGNTLSLVDPSSITLNAVNNGIRNPWIPESGLYVMVGKSSFSFTYDGTSVVDYSCFITGNNSKVYVERDSPSSGQHTVWFANCDNYGIYCSKTLQGYASSANSGQYPADGVSGNVWYTKQGSDNIDASAVSIPSTIMGGTQITITVTPGSGKVYAGTVSYIYQVKLGSGSWTTIATTTATTRTYTVPYGTESIQVRVQAKDDIGFTSSDYATSSAVTVINNQPPTAPGSIEVTNVVSGQQCTITITAATDPDGTVESYIYERSVDGSAWEQIANVNALTHNDTINAEWGTVAYRAKAVDDDGDSGPYVTSQTSVVNSGWVIISGPANDMGDKPAPFEFELSVSISGQETSDNITVDITLDGQSVYSQAVAPNTPISIDVDTRTMRAGSHSFAVAATCDTYVPASGEYTFNVPEITIPDGGRMDQLEGQDGNVIFPITLARAVAGLENYGVESKVHPGAYTGTGTYGTNNPNTLEFEFEPKMVLIQGTAGRVAILIKPSGVGVSIGPNESTTLNVTWQGKTVSWYNALNAANQMNTENEIYSYTAFG